MINEHLDSTDISEEHSSIRTDLGLFAVSTGGLVVNSLLGKHFLENHEYVPGGLAVTSALVIGAIAGIIAKDSIKRTSC